MALKKITLRDVAEALINDPTPKIKGTYFKSKASKGEMVSYSDAQGGTDSWDPPIGASCAIGGAALMLGVSPRGLEAVLDNVQCNLGLGPDSQVLKHNRKYNEKQETVWCIQDIIIGLNDSTSMSKKEIGERILRYCADFLDVKFTVQEARLRVQKRFAGITKGVTE